MVTRVRIAVSSIVLGAVALAGVFSLVSGRHSPSSYRVTFQFSAPCRNFGLENVAGSNWVDHLAPPSWQSSVTGTFRIVDRNHAVLTGPDGKRDNFTRLTT